MLFLRYSVSVACQSCGACVKLSDTRDRPTVSFVKALSKEVKSGLVAQGWRVNNKTECPQCSNKSRLPSGRKVGRPTKTVIKPARHTGNVMQTHLRASR